MVMREYDVIVAGAGNAALSAAVAAREHGAASVLVLEKAPRAMRGGNTHWAGAVLRFAFDDPRELEPLLPAVGGFLAVSLACPGRCRGVLYLCRAAGDEPFGPQELEAVQAVSHFLEQGSLFEEARSALDDLAIAGHARPLHRLDLGALGELGPDVLGGVHGLPKMKNGSGTKFWLTPATWPRLLTVNATLS